VNFTTNEVQCRSKMIGTYFNDDKISACGICDNCLRNKKIIITSEEFNAISGQIKKEIYQNPISSSDLFQKLIPFRENKIWKVLTFLQEEKVISINSEGLIKGI